MPDVTDTTNHLGRHYTIKKIAGAAAVTIDPNGSQKIDGQLTYSLLNPDQEVSIAADQTDANQANWSWKILDAISKLTLDATTFPGADFGAQFNAAQVALPATGGKILCPPGSHGFSTPIVINKNVDLECAGAGFTNVLQLPQQTSIDVSLYGTLLNWTGGSSSAKPIGTVSRLSSVVTVTTTTTHGFLVGEPVEVYGVVDSGFNGTFMVCGPATAGCITPTLTQFTYQQAGAPVSSSGGMTTNVLITTASRTDPDLQNLTNPLIVTITTNRSHGYQVGWPVGIDRTGDSSFHGKFAICGPPTTGCITPAGTQFTYQQQPGKTLISTSGGIAVAGGVAMTVIGSNVRARLKGFALENTGSGAVAMDVDEFANGVVVEDVFARTEVGTGWSVAAFRLGEVNPVVDVTLRDVQARSNTVGELTCGSEP